MTEWKARILRRMEEDLSAGRIPGASVCVCRGGQILLEGHVGNATPSSLFRIASMTKPITAVAVLKLWEGGKLELTDPVIKYLPGFDPRLQIRHLLTHTSGLSQSRYAENITDAEREDPDQLLDYIANVPFDHAPGTHAEYSPVAAFALLTAIVEQVAGVDFPTFAEREIFLPCDMKNTTFLPTKAQWAALVPMEDTKPGCVFESYPVTNPLGGAGLVSCMEDYKHFAQMLLQKGQFQGKRILKEETVIAMSSTQVPESVQPGSVRWGYGVRVVVDKNRLPIGAFGWSGAYGTHFWIDPANDLFAIYMKNSRQDGGASAITAAHLEEDVYTK